MIAQDEISIDDYDGEIKIKDTVGRDDLLIHFVCDYGFRYGKAIRTWPGSWCCEEMVISRKDGIKILKYLIKEGFTEDMIIGSDSLEDAIKQIDYQGVKV